MDYDIAYERDIYRSYMKIVAVEKENLDEKILLSHNMEGMLSMEKNFFQGKGQYWYDISGKQALDNYCKTNEVSAELLEQLILQICNQLERFEWNLLRAECLLLQPETIFISVSDEKIYFTGYPKESGSIYGEIQSFMEFILTKINHSDTEAVRGAYEIYELILKGEFHISDLRDFIIERRRIKQSELKKEEETKSFVVEDVYVEKREEEVPRVQMPYQLLVSNLRDKVSQILGKVRTHKEDKEEVDAVIYPDEDMDAEIPINIHPTVCLTSMAETPSGILIYEGTENYGDFEIGTSSCVVGKSHRVKLQIEKSTISHFHAKIEYKEDGYYIEDMNSTNGTYVNDEILNFRESKKLYSGDIVRFADVKYRFI